MTGDLIKSSVRVVKHPTKKEWGVVYFNRYGKGFYAMNKNSSTSRWYGHSRDKAYALAKQLKNRRKKW